MPERIPTSKVFNAFCHLQSNPKYDRWLGSLYFEKEARNCVSKDLEEVLFSLGAFGLVSVENHDYRYLRITDATRRKIRGRVEKSTKPGDLRVLRDLSVEFSKLVKVKA
jgi:hypothetical protein